MSRADATAGAEPCGPAASTYLRWLAVLAVTYTITHHIGVAFAWLGSIGETAGPTGSTSSPRTPSSSRPPPHWRPEERNAATGSCIS